MDEYESLSHGQSGCKHHVVFIAKGRPRALSAELRQYCRWKQTPCSVAGGFVQDEVR